MEVLDFILSGAETKRYHTQPTVREDKVGAHSFRVAMLYSLMAGDHTPTEAEPVSLGVPGLMACLTHDLPEHKIGDLPSPAKRAMPSYFPDGANPARTFREVWGEMEEKLLDDQGLRWDNLLTSIEKRWVALADNMDGALFCIRERMLGNRLMNAVFHNYRRYIGEVMGGEPQPMEAQIIDYIDDMWEQANG